METVDSVTKWANETFGEATAYHQFLKAKSELEELSCLFGNNTIGPKEFPTWSQRVAEEAADVVICLYRIIGTMNPRAIDEKMAINRARTWTLDGKGCAQHVAD